MNRELKRPDLNKPGFQLFPDLTNRVRENICTTCPAHIDITKFRDETSVREYGISGMCQDCQDSAFEEPEEN